MDSYNTNPSPSPGKKPSLATRIYQYLATHSCTTFYGLLGGGAILLYFYGYQFHAPVCSRIGERIFFAGILIFLVHFNQRKLFAFLHVNSNVSHLPKQQIRLMNGFFLAFFMFLTILAMILLPALPYREFVTSLGGLLIAVIRYIVSLIYHPGPQSQVVDVAPEESADFMSMFPENTKAPNEILMFLADFITKAIAVIFLAYVVYRLVCFLYYKVIELKNRKQKIYSDTFVTPLMRREKLKKKEDRPEKLAWNDFSSAGRIRRRYKKTIQAGLSSRTQDISPGFTPQAATPQELETQAGLTGTVENAQLHEAYEKARYGRVSSKTE